MDEKASNEDNRLSHIGIFESLFRISERLDKKVFLYGLNEDTKKALVFLTSFQVSVEGFLLTKEQSDLNGMFYLGRPAISGAQLSSAYNDPYIVLDVYGDHLAEIRRELQTDKNIQILFWTPENRLAIYGAGKSGNCLYRLLCRCGIKVDFFCDKNADEILSVGDVPVILPVALDDKAKDYFIAIAIDDRAAAQQVREMLCVKKFSKMDIFDSFFLQYRFTEQVWIKRKQEYNPVFRPIGLHYIRKMFTQGKDIYLFGDDISYLADTGSILNKLGIPVRYGISTNVSEEVTVGNFKIFNAYELLYEDLSNCVIWALINEEDNAKIFMRKSGIDKEKFLYSSTGPLYLDRTYILDTHLGYIDGRGSIIERNCQAGDKLIKVAILGGSTSDYDLYFEKSWPACLLEIAKQNGIGMEVICAATAGNTSAMELIRLVRDVIQQKPDVVISYSRANEISHSVEGHRFTHNYQKALFDSIVQTEKIDSFFGLKRNEIYYMGEETSDPAQLWLDNERMMRAICDEFGVAFYAFLQPVLYEKKPKSLMDKKLLEHITDDFARQREQLAELAEKVKTHIQEYPWLYDFTAIFDNMDKEVFFDQCHVLESANWLIAEKILPILIEGQKWEKSIC